MGGKDPVESAVARYFRRFPKSSAIHEQGSDVEIVNSQEQ
jgi:hypothetical protein